ncbi:hypothetical protein [Streptacidiphilus anmyonensis]|uniref:hypothetical protein n=1 Tax=Streptacidiphilus anmyonensis TaxID=405782 RepID=UPI001364BECC|nr:hypothetical protein [Streptacidiphilus anmyonensis]
MRLNWAEVEQRAREIVAEYPPASVTLRQLYYRLQSAGVIPAKASVYRRLSSHLAQARREGRFPDLVDTVRRIHVLPHWDDHSQFLAQMPQWFRLDRTRGQECALYLAAEKDTLRSMFTSWVEDLGIPVVVVRGYGSQSYAQQVQERVARDPRPAWLTICGDFDASGEDIQRDWVERTGCWAGVERLLLSWEQVQEYGLPATEGKRGDPRWPAFAERYGFDVENPVQWEVEALPPEELERLVRRAVEPFVDRAVLREVLAEEAQQRAELDAFLGTWQSPGTA